MPVPSKISDLTSVASTNSPQGTEPVRGTIDDYLRAHASFIRQLLDLVCGPTVTLPSAATVNIGFAASVNVTISGTTTIVAFDNVDEGALRHVTFAGALTLVHSAGLQLPGAANIVTAAGDVATFKSLGGGNWKCINYQRSSGAGPVAASMLTDGYLTKGDWNSFNSRLTPAAAAATYLALAGGGNMAANINFNNNYGLCARDAGGTLRQWLTVASDNNTYFTNTGGQNIIFNNVLGTGIAKLSNAGSFEAVVVTETSDGRLKKLWRRLAPDLLQNVAALRNVGTFVWRKGPAAGRMGMGGSAQEIETFMPWAVVTDDKGFKSVRYGAAAFVIAVELTRAFFAHVAKTEKRLAKMEGK